ncbi:MAG: hypothetical protein H7A37_00820 [Chlamydiales bacterium]|nr:hypothetical protein [Chlamydiia bacterium]MCP5506835.1 hypothetical protein [Chlamydiales bacterium]
MMSALFVLILIALILVWKEEHQWAITIFLFDAVLGVMMLWHHMSDHIPLNY